MERIENILKEINSTMNALFFGVIISGVALYIGHRINSSSDQLRNKVSILADTDKNNITTIDEWKKVYQELGVNYNELQPRELNRSQMKKYISTHQF